MTDDIRTRIADIVQRKMDVGEGCLRYDAERIADAVIRELQIKVEDGECSYCHAMLPGCRYSTWKATDE